MTVSASPGQASGVLPETNSRLKNLPTYVFAELEQLKDAARKRGVDLLDLGMGNPDLATPPAIVAEIQRAVADPANHRYPNFKGIPRLRNAIVGWMQRRYGVEIDVDTEIQPLIGSKEGLAHLTFGYTEAGTYSLVPSPYYPVHSRATWLAGGEVFHLPLTAENGFLPDLDSIPPDVAQKAKLFFVNYPNNPCAATAELPFYEKLVAYCKQHQIILVSDLAYGEIAFDGYRPPSALQVPGAKDITVEFHSFSKSFSMAGWRIGFAVGNQEIIKTLYSVKTNLDYGVSAALQEGASLALEQAETFLPDIVATYQARRDLLVKGFRELGFPAEPTKATMYLWLPIPPAFSDAKEWCHYLLEKTGVMITPGYAFGTDGNRYFRVSLIGDNAMLETALKRMKEAGVRYQ